MIFSASAFLEAVAAAKPFRAIFLSFVLAWAAFDPDLSQTQATDSEAKDIKAPSWPERARSIESMGKIEIWTAMACRADRTGSESCASEICDMTPFPKFCS
jgi:hypothetical protein